MKTKFNEKQIKTVKDSVIKSVPVTLANTQNRVDLAYMVSCATAFITLSGNLKHFEQFMKDFHLDGKPSDILAEVKADERP